MGGSIVYKGMALATPKLMLERFIEEYSEKGYQFAYHLCGREDQAKELVQEAFVRVLRQWERCDRSQSQENWFLTILRNLHYDSLKRYERRNTVSWDAPLLGCGEDEGRTLAALVADDRDEAMLERLERQEASAEVRAVLDSLAAEHKVVLVLCDMQALSYAEIAEVLDCPVGTVRSRLYRARAAFRRALAGKSGEVVS